MWDHISKPLDVQAMFNTMAKWIKPASRQMVPEQLAADSEQPEGLSEKVAAELNRTSGESEKSDEKMQPALSSSVGVGEDAALTEALGRLAALLQDSDADAADVLDDIAQMAKGTPLAASLKVVRRAVDDFDFDAALAALQSIR